MIVAAKAGEQTQQHCVWDYFKFCGQYPLASKKVEQCMADVGIKLSKPCIRALVADKYITKEQVIEKAKQQGFLVAETPRGLDIVGKWPPAEVTPEFVQEKVSDEPVVAVNKPKPAPPKKATAPIIKKEALKKVIVASKPRPKVYKKPSTNPMGSVYNNLDWTDSIFRDYKKYSK